MTLDNDIPVRTIKLLEELDRLMLNRASNEVTIESGGIYSQDIMTPQGRLMWICLPDELADNDTEILAVALLQEAILPEHVFFVIDENKLIEGLPLAGAVVPASRAYPVSREISGCFKAGQLSEQATQQLAAAVMATVPKQDQEYHKQSDEMSAVWDAMRILQEHSFQIATPGPETAATDLP